MAVPFPDVCKTPTPAGPVPIPYPNLDKSSDTSKGSKSVKVDGKMMTAKGATFSTSEGDEPGTAGPGVKAAEGGMLKLITPDAPQPRLPAREAPEPPSPEDRKAELLRLLAPSAEE